MNFDPPSIAANLANLRRLWDAADAIDRFEGAAAYPRYSAMMAKVAEHYNAEPLAVAGVFAALSPNNDYLGNLRSLCSILHGWRSGWSESECVVTTYHHNRGRAWAILSGAHPLSIFKGPKIRNFFVNIADPANGYAVTIDGHMVGAWLGVRLTMDRAGTTRKSYDQIADGFRFLAGQLHISPAQLQATLWFVQKRVHRVLYDAQTSLFNAGDQWKIDRDLSEITRFGNGPFRKATPGLDWRNKPSKKFKGRKTTPPIRTADLLPR